MTIETSNKSKLFKWKCSYVNFKHGNVSFKDTHKEKAQSNETPAFTKSTNMGIWVVGTTNQLFIRGY